VPFLLAPLIALVTALPGTLLLVITVLFALGFLHALASSPELLFQFMLIGLLLAFLWYLYLHLPHFLRRFISRLFSRSKRNHNDH
jgi:hypothetical protein